MVFPTYEEIRDMKTTDKILAAAEGWIRGRGMGVCVETDGISGVLAVIDRYHPGGFQGFATAVFPGGNTEDVVKALTESVTNKEVTDGPHHSVDRILRGSLISAYQQGYGDAYAGKTPFFRDASQSSALYYNGYDDGEKDVVNDAVKEPFEDYDHFLEWMVVGYTECALWSSTDDNDIPLDHGECLLADATTASFRADCELFALAYGRVIAKLDAAQVGHDFWLTRNGHGTGFWDRTGDDLGFSDIATKELDAYNRLGEVVGFGTEYPAVGLYVGDDGLIYAE